MKIVRRVTGKNHTDVGWWLEFFRDFWRSVERTISPNETKKTPMIPVTQFMSFTLELVLVTTKTLRIELSQAAFSEGP
jgi:hypothetical protein